MPCHCSLFSPPTSVRGCSSGSKLCVTQPQKSFPYQNSSISYPQLAGNILFHNILNQLCLLYSASFEFSCFCYTCLSVVYWYCHLLTHSLALRPCESLGLLICGLPFCMDCLLLPSHNHNHN